MVIEVTEKNQIKICETLISKTLNNTINSFKRIDQMEERISDLEQEFLNNPIKQIN